MSQIVALDTTRRRPQPQPSRRPSTTLFVHIRKTCLIATVPAPRAKRT